MLFFSMASSFPLRVGAGCFLIWELVYDVFVVGSGDA